MQIGEILVTKGVITSDQLGKALEAQKSGGGKLGEVLVKLGFASADKIEAALK